MYSTVHTTTLKIQFVEPELVVKIQYSFFYHIPQIVYISLSLKDEPNGCCSQCRDNMCSCMVISLKPDVHAQIVQAFDIFI